MALRSDVESHGRGGGRAGGIGGRGGGERAETDRPDRVLFVRGRELDELTEAIARRR